MKQPANWLVLFLLLIFNPFALTACPESSFHEWQNLVRSGKGCFPPNCSEGQFPMAVMPVVAFEGKLWSVGQNAVWSSPDGLTWRSEPKTDWGERHGMSYVYFKDRIWMSGGMRSWDKFTNDIWNSVDGKTWAQITANASWAPRRDHKLVIFKEKLWLIGGAESSGRADMTPVRWFNDVWSSDDGIQWTRVLASAPWQGRSLHTTFVFDDRLWVLGGMGKADVWSSPDGKTWTQITGNAPWGQRHGNGALVFDGRMWVFGGVDKNDVWSSRDGKNWKLEMGRAPWSTRAAWYSVVFKDALWLFSGKTGRDDTWAGDIWIMRRRPAS